MVSSWFFNDFCYYIDDLITIRIIWKFEKLASEISERLDPVGGSIISKTIPSLSWLNFRLTPKENRPHQIFNKFRKLKFK